MQINTIKLFNKKKTRKRVGRGGKKGTYSGKGMKGQKARSGVSMDPLFEGGRSTLIDRMKKKRGFKSNKSKKTIISLLKMSQKFNNNDIVNKDSLIKKGLINKTESKNEIKILGKSDLKVKLNIDKRIILSQSAKKSIEKADGTIC